MIIHLKKISLFSMGILLVTGFIFLSSFTRLQELKEKGEKIDEMIKRLKAENIRLKQQIQYLKDEPLYQEKVLREKIGLVRKGEVPFKIETEEDLE